MNEIKHGNSVGITNLFSNIQFDRKNHRYSLNGKILTPTTELISTLEREVNWAEQAQKVAIREGTSQDLILKQWGDNNEKAANKGTEVHEYIQRRLKFNTETDTKYQEMIAFDEFWKKSQQKLRVEQIEWIIGDYNLGIGGTIDCLFHSSNTNKYHIFDWKSNKKFTQQNGWQNLLPPFDDLEDCHLIKYSLQLSVYKVILQCNTDLNLGESYIIWLNSDYQGEFFTSIRALDFTDRIKDWLKSI